MVTVIDTLDARALRHPEKASYVRMLAVLKKPDWLQVKRAGLSAGLPAHAR